MAEQAVAIVNSKEAVQQSGVAKVDLGRFDLALRDADVPGLELPDQEGAGQDVETGAHRLVT
jgi:hypothetical protein